MHRCRALAPALFRTVHLLGRMRLVVAFALLLALSAVGGQSTSAQVPSTPSLTSATAGNHSVVLVWAAATNAISYNVYRGTAAGGEGATAINTSAITATTYNDQTALNGQIYYYKVKAVNGANSSALSNEKSATPVLPAPTALAASAAGAQISVSWTATPGAASYTIIRGTSPGTEDTANPVQIGQAASPYVDTPPSAGVKYYYKVKAVDATSSSVYSSEVSATTASAAPTGLAAVTSSTTQINLTWTASTGAVSYNVYRGPSPGGEIATAVKTGVTTASTSDTGLTAGTLYYYTVKAVNTGGTSAASNEASAITKPAAPTGVTATPGNASVTISWAATFGAASYNVYRSTSSAGTFTQINSSPVTALTYPDTGLTNGTPFWYKVSAVNAGGEGAQSSSVSATPLAAPAAPASLTATTVSSSQINLSWPSAATASSYKLERSANGTSGWTQIANPTTTSYSNNTGLTSNTTFYYRVRASNAGGDSPYSPTASAKTATDAPTGLTVTSVSATTINLSWTAVTGATSYTIYRGNSSGTETSVATGVTTTTYPNTGRAAGTTYWYEVKAVNSGGASAFSNEVSATTLPAAPGGLTATAGNGQVSLAWSAVTGATNYIVKRGAAGGGSGGPFTNVQTVTAPTTTWVDMNVTNGSTYWYEVSAVSAGGEGAPYGPVSALPDAVPDVPTGLTATGNGYANIILNWSAAARATSYKIELSTDNINWSTTSQMSFTGATQAQVFTLATDTLYYFRVTATSAGGDSAPSAVASARTWFFAPTSLTATAGSQQITLNWTANSSATSFHVRRSSAAGGPYTTVATVNNTTTCVDMNLAPVKYYYVVTGVSSTYESGPSNEASAVPTAPAGTAAYNIDSGGPGAAPYVADEFYTSNTSSPYTFGSNFDTSAVANPAPQSVYQTGRQYDFTYTIPGLAPNTAHSVRLHFVEAYYNLPGQRTFNVSVNGAPMLTNFDVIAAAGGQNKAIAETFNATSDASGVITINFATVTAGAIVNAIDVYTGSALPDKPVTLTATPGNAQVSLSWIGPNATGYNVKRGTTMGGPYTTIATNISNSSYTDNIGLTNNTVYYYVVSGVNGVGEGQNSNEASAMPYASSAFAINAGGDAAPPFAADQNFAGGNPFWNLVPIDMSGLVNPAPLAVYQTQRMGAFSYAVTGLTASQTYTLRLHFDEIAGDATVPGERVFDVFANGTRILSAFDILAATGKANKAIIEQFNVPADGTGAINVSLNPIFGYAVLNGLEVTSGSSAPATPYNLTAVSGNAQVTLYWASVYGATGYNVKRSSTPGGPYTVIGTSATTSYLDQPVTNGATYYYVVSAVAAGKEGANSNEAVGTPVGSNGAVLRINSGGNAVGAFSGDQMYIGGGPETVANSIDVSGVASAAPVAVYQSRRNHFDTFSYSLSGLQAMANYTVRLHFAELNGVLPGYRLANVAINGNQVLTNFDIAAAAGAVNRAVVEQFNAYSNSAGIIELSFGKAGTNNVQVNGIEVLSGFSAPSAPNCLVAIPENNQVRLYWNTLYGATGYNVKRGPSSSGPFTTLPSGANVGAATFTDTTAFNGTTYYYVVTALNANGESANSNVASATPAAAGAVEYRVNGGGPAVAPYVLDQYFVGGNTGDGTTSTIDTSSVTNPAPMSVYQSRHTDLAGFTYTFPHLTPGASYTVRLHFAEIAVAAPGQRYFSVAINNVTVLSHVDLFQVAGAMNKAFVMPYATTADGTGKIVVQFTGEYQNAQVNGIEVVTGNTSPPAPPTNLKAVKGASQVGLMWDAVVGAATYNVYRGTVSGGPYSQIATGLASTTYSDPVNANIATYYYVVTAVSPAGESVKSNEATPVSPFTLSANPASLSLLLGSGGISTITASSAVGFVDPIQIAITGTTPNMTAMCYPGSISISPQQPYPSSLMLGTTKLHICSVGGAPATYTLTITGTSGDYSASTTVTVTTH